MFNWNYQDQVTDTLWGEHKEIGDHIVPQPEGNSFSKFGQCSKKQRNGDYNNSESSTLEPSEPKNEFLICNVENNCGVKIDQELKDSGMDMDAWPDLPNLSMPFGGNFNVGNGRDSFETELSDLASCSVLKSVGGVMGGYNHSAGLLHDKGLPSAKTYILLAGNEMQLDSDPELFGHGEKGNDGFGDYDWANIEDLGDFDMFRNNDSLFENEMIQDASTFLASSTDVISRTSQSIPVPDLPLSREQAWDKSSSSDQIMEHLETKLNPLRKEKTDMQNLTPGTQKKEGKRKEGSSKGSNSSRPNKNHQITTPAMQPSTTNPPRVFQSQIKQQISSSHHAMLAEYGYPACHQLSSMPLPSQILGVNNQHNLVSGGFSSNPDYSKHPKQAEPSPKPMSMTPQEKIEKLRRRQQMQAMLAIQKQREQYNHQNSVTDQTSSQLYWQNTHNQDFTRGMEEYNLKLPSSESSQAEQDQYQLISCSLNGRSVEEAIYYQLQDAMEKLDLRVRLCIRDSLYRLARSSMERQNASDRSSTNKTNKEEDEISADEESYQQDRSSKIQNSEAVTNPIDRIIAHLLFHNPSGSSLMPIADGNMSTATST
ncbi:hypothetical protein HPP92_013521 [Vanilla planifolia]|uniref:Protein LNK2 n=1 Tax=Vanilla planifolia TaxID=51239 RepID=A0A835R245_VANPL|nr:hypothetical protein HPP92_013972 [Vanilla planifolia]KAG0478802.1 hypothetical protein HPP92_013521 [Vanilla planifolia]